MPPRDVIAALEEVYSTPSDDCMGMLCDVLAPDAGEFVVSVIATYASTMAVYMPAEAAYRATFRVRTSPVLPAEILATTANR